MAEPAPLLDSDNRNRQALVVEADSSFVRRDLAEVGFAVVDSKIVVGELEPYPRARVPSLQKPRHIIFTIFIHRREPALVVAAKGVPSRAARIQVLNR